jgi:hypothetical protein
MKGVINRVEQLPLESGEREAWRVTANRSYDGVAVGGRLLVTDRRILFRPTCFEHGLGREGWECSLSDVVNVDLAERELNFFSGGLRRRLRIRTKAGSELSLGNSLLNTFYASAVTAGKDDTTSQPGVPAGA